MNYFEGEGSYYDSDELGYLDKWFLSPEWVEVTDNANDGCEDSLELMDDVSNQLASLIFHLKNNSSEHRIEYELSYFKKLCEDFEIE